MKKHLILVAGLLTASLAGPLVSLHGQAESTPPPAKLALEDNMCLACHGNADLWEGETQHLFVGAEHLAGDIHWKKGLQCQDCHGGNPTVTELRQAHATEDGFRRIETPADEPGFCSHCHEHEQASAEYWASVHGKGLRDAGLLKTAVCTSCHGIHGIATVDDPASTLHVTNVAKTCGACHRLIEERLLKSVHGRGAGPGGANASPAPGGTTQRKPSCTDCHKGHALSDPRSAAFRNQESNQCGDCHTELNRAYGMSMHGALSNLGYTEGAKCSDCHGAHDILPLSDPNSRMSPANRLQTCSKCHQGMPANLASFDPHADQYDQNRSAVIYWVYHGVLTFIIVVFGFFGLHAVVWFIRGLFDVLKHGRPKQLGPGTAGYVRFKPFHRVAHTVMVVSFLGLALTGLPLKFSDYGWAQWLAAALGGFSSTGLWHRVFSISMFGCFLAYLVLLTRCYFVGRRQGRSRKDTLFGPDSPLPNLRNARDFGAMVRWFLGRGPKPTFERWAYWEKFDFFGATSDTILIGLSGLILWFPNWFCIFLPGEAVNVAKVVHSTLALLATGFVFAIHFFGTHFRPDKFPMDMSILTGVVSEEEMRHERPEVLERLRAEGRLEESQTSAPARGKLCAVRISGFLALLIGLAALAGIIWSLLPN